MTCPNCNGEEEIIDEDETGEFRVCIECGGERWCFPNQDDCPVCSSAIQEMTTVQSGYIQFCFRCGWLSTWTDEEVKMKKENFVNNNPPMICGKCGSKNVTETGYTQPRSDMMCNECGHEWFEEVKPIEDNTESEATE